MAKSSRQDAATPPVPDQAKPSVVTGVVALRGTETWLAWLQALADHCGLPPTYTIDQALKGHAKAVGFDQPMPRRVTR